jgi:hypothetical protein
MAKVTPNQERLKSRDLAIKKLEKNKPIHNRFKSGAISFYIELNFGKQ